MLFIMFLIAIFFSHPVITDSRYYGHKTAVPKVSAKEGLRFTFTPNSRREFVLRLTKFSPYFPFTLYCFYTKISSFMPILIIGIVPDCFYLLIFYSEKFSTWVWRLPFAVNVNLNLSNKRSWLYSARRIFNSLLRVLVKHSWLIRNIR